MGRSNHWREELSPSLLLKDGLAYNLSMTALILGSLRWNPEIWVGDYPPDIREKYGPPGPRARKQGLLVAGPFFLLGGGGVLWSSLRLKRRNGGSLSFQAAFLHIFALILSFWLFDLAVLDWLVFVTLTPDFVVLPGTEGMAGYDDYGFHLRAHLKAAPMLAGFSALLALVALALPPAGSAKGGA
jgi:hypothetical protein